MSDFEIIEKNSIMNFNVATQGQLQSLHARVTRMTPIVAIRQNMHGLNPGKKEIQNRTQRILNW